MEIYCSKRSSGAVSLLETVPHSHSVTLGFWFPVGSGIETDGERGFSHFIEHMLFKGTTTRNALTLAREAERAGGYLNAFTERSQLCIHCTLPSDQWLVAVKLLGDMAFHSVFDPTEFEREKAVVRSEVLAVFDDPDEDSNDEFHARIWKGHPFSRRVAGEPEEVDRTTRDDLFRFYKTYFNPNNLTIAAVGSFDPREMETALDSVLEGAPNGSIVPKPTTPNYHQGLWTHRASVGQVYLVAGTSFRKTLSREDLCALDALNCAFGESSSSRLFQNIRETQGLCYSIGSSFSSTNSFGMFYVSAICSGASFPKLWDMVRQELELLRNKGLTEAEVTDAVEHLHGQDMVAADDTDARMRALARQWMRYGSAKPYLELVEEIRCVDVDNVRRVRDMLFEEPFSALAYGSVGVRVRKALGVNE